MRHDLLSDVLSQIKNAENAAKSEIIVRPTSKMVRSVLKIVHDMGYLGEIEYIDDGRGGKLKIELLGKINNAGAIRPRFKAGVFDLEKFEKRYLPARGFGFLVVSTSKGIMTHLECKKKSIGGLLLAFIY
jgi:small subunit ribosomal protein S8